MQPTSSLLAAERVSKARGPSPSLPKLSELGLRNLISDVADEMERRRPPDPCTGPTFKGRTPDLDTGPNAARRREMLQTLPLNTFEILCYEVCHEIRRRYLSPEEDQKALINMDGREVPRFSIPDNKGVKANQAGQRWQIPNAMDGDWSDSSISCDEWDESSSEDESPLPSPVDTLHVDLHQPSEPDAVNDRPNADLEIVCNRLLEIFQDRSRYKLLLGYRDLEAQAILDLLQNLLDSPQVRSSRLKKELVVAVQRLSKKSALYPECFVLKDISIEKNTDGSIHAYSSGKFGEVWRGNKGGQDVCLKVMRVYRNSKIHELLKAFSCEAVLWSHLQHANVLPFYGVYRLQHPSHNRICLVSPWMSNGNIDEFLSNEPEADRAALIINIAAGLKYLHAHNVVHGDLKGANVLVNSSKRACLADFGLSTIRDPEVLALTTTNSGGGSGGTIRWMSPELLSPDDYNEPFSTKESDVYAFAGVSYEIFTGHVPYYEVFREQTVILKVNRGERPSRPDQSTFSKSGLTELIWQLMQDCWLTDPDDRPTASDILIRLTQAYKRNGRSRVPTRRAPNSGRSTPSGPGKISASEAQEKLLLSPLSFRASFSQAADLGDQLRRKELLRLLEISTGFLLDHS